MQILLWIALGLFFIAIVAPRRVAYPIGAVGWIFSPCIGLINLYIISQSTTISTL
jgi:hypothetical protein